MNQHGFLCIDKPKGITSFAVCHHIRKQLGIKKVGHTGTLDPFATGLLVVATGKATKCIPYLEKSKKTYQTVLALGAETETLDCDSEVIERETKDIPIPTQKDIQTVLDTHFKGSIQQIPPQYSALKVDGKRAYDRARKGESFTLKPRETHIFQSKIIDYSFPHITIELTVSAGFYVRSFARDLGRIVFGGGYCKSLRRTAIDDISITQAQNMNDYFQVQDVQNILQFHTFPIEANRIPDFISGRAFRVSHPDQKNICIQHQQKTIGIGHIMQNMLHPRIVLIDSLGGQ